MKRFIKVFILIAIFGLFTFTVSNAAIVNGNYDYTIFDNEGYNLENGLSVTNQNMSRTNKVLIANNSDDNKLYFDNNDFSHVLFFNSSNIYLGYANGAGSTLQLSSYIGTVQATGDDYYIEVPDKAKKFALMNYNYNDTRNQIAYAFPDIDDLTYDNVSYRDIMSNYVYFNPEFTNDSGHAPYNATETVLDGNYILTGDGTANNPNVTTSPAGNIAFFSPIYVNVKVRALNDDVQAINVNFNTGTGVYTESVTNPTNGEWYIISFVASSTVSNSLITEIVYPDAATANGAQVEFDYIYGISVKDLSPVPQASIMDDILYTYRTYKDVSGNTFTYNDIFGDSLHGTGKTNLIDNGDFSNGATGYYVENANITIIDGIVNIYDEGEVPTWGRIRTASGGNVLSSDKLYLSMDLYRVNNSYFRIFPRNGTNDVDFIENITPSLNEWFTYSKLYTPNFDSLDYRINLDMFGDKTLDTLLYKTDNWLLYNLSSIFGAGFEPDIVTFETWLDTYVDPLADFYPNYYQAATLITNTVYYKYDDTPPEPADFQNSFNDSIESIGIDTPQERMFGAFLIMALVAVVVGLKFKSTAVISIVELVLILIFTVIGWFDLWFILALTMIFVLLLMLKFIKKE